MNNEIEQTELYKKFKRALNINNDMRPGPNPFVVECCNIAEQYASQQTQGEWISVEDRLPEPFKEVIVSDGIEVRSGFYDSEFKKMEIRKKYQFNPVTHWQPLPPPPNPTTP